MRKLPLAAIVLLAVACQGCTALKVAGIVQGALIVGSTTRVATYVYNGQPYQGAGFADVADSVNASGHVPVQMAAIEVNDAGYFANPEQARRVLEGLTAMAREYNLSIVVYAHGWRHNSSRGDPDVEQFRNALNTLNGIVRMTAPTPSSSMNGAPLPRMVVGIYLGWKGKTTFEWPDPPKWLGVLKGAASLHVYTTFWSRKTAADRAGQGDMRRFITTLAEMHGGWRMPATSYNSHSLNLIGHSFGGHLMLSALRDQLEATLLSAETRGDGLPPAMLHMPNDPSYKGVQLSERLTSKFGNIILINPAVEEVHLRYIYEMSRVTQFPDSQPPFISVFSAENDKARSLLFRAGTMLSSGSVHYRPGQGRLATTALGSGEEFVTHRLALVSETKESERYVSEKVDSSLSIRPRPIPAQATSGVRWAAEDIANPDGRVRLVSIGSERRSRAAVIATVDKRIIDGHSDFWRRGFIEWLVSYVVALDRAQVRPPPAR